VRELMVIGVIDHDVFDKKKKENRQRNNRYIMRE